MSLAVEEDLCLPKEFVKLVERGSSDYLRGDAEAKKKRFLILTEVCQVGLPMVP